jgi:uncharacterized protein YabE (DUF348 family)/3D (Asp-Asp-Asp) domain-containing protein
MPAARRGDVVHEETGVTVLPASPAAGARSGVVSGVILTVGLLSALTAGMAYGALRKEVVIRTPDGTLRMVTYRRTVREVLAQAGVSPAPSDEVDPPLAARVEEGMTIAVRPAVALTVIADGQVRSLQTAAATVAEVLAREGLRLGPADRVFPAPDTPVTEGLRVRVIRIAHRLEVEQVRVPYQVRTLRNPSAPRGLLRLVRPGQEGLRERLWRVTLADGRVVARTLVGERVVRPPVDRVISVGTVVQIASRGPFAGHEVLEMLATAYAPFCCPGVDDITSTGMRAGFGVVAVDPQVIPLGSLLFIEGYGHAVAGDVGGRIKGLRIDLGFDTTAQARRFGVRRVRVYLLERGRP